VNKALRKLAEDGLSWCGGIGVVMVVGRNDGPRGGEFIFIRGVEIFGVLSLVSFSV
jgi:hypothetical protein